MTINWTSEFDTSISLFDFENSSINPFLIFDEFNTTGSYNDFNISTAIAILSIKSNRELWRDIPLGCTLTILSLLTLVGNALVLHAVRTERRLQTVSSTQTHIVLLLKWLFFHEPNVCVWVFTCLHRDLFYLHIYLYDTHFRNINVWGIHLPNFTQFQNVGKMKRLFGEMLSGH